MATLHGRAPTAFLTAVILMDELQRLSRRRLE
jgi:hypothetical protein